MLLSNGNRFRTRCCGRICTRNRSSKNWNFAEVVTSSNYSRTGRVDSRDCKRRRDLHLAHPSIQLQFQQFLAKNSDPIYYFKPPDGTFNKCGRPRLDPARDHGGAPIGAEVDPHPAASPASGGRSRCSGEGRGRSSGSGRVQVAVAAAGAGSDDGSSPAAAQAAPAAEAARLDGGGNAPAAAQTIGIWRRNCGIGRRRARRIGQ